MVAHDGGLLLHGAKISCNSMLATQLDRKQPVVGRVLCPGSTVGADTPLNPKPEKPHTGRP